MWVYRVCPAVMLLLYSCFAADMQSRYIRKEARNRGVIVFVHGLMGDSKATWTNAKTGAYWPDLLTKDAAFDGFDVYVYEYDSPKLSTSYSPDEIAENMRLLFDSDGVSKHQSIVFLTHSLGGIVTRAYLKKYRRTAQRVRFIYFFSTPTTGAEIARLGALISKNPQFYKLRPMTSESYLADLQRDWMDAQFSFPSYCAYEKQPTMGQLIVEQQSASNLCQHLDPIEANHVDIVKPENTRSESYLAFLAAFNEVIKNAASKARPIHQPLISAGGDASSGGGTISSPAKRDEGGGNLTQTQISAPNGIAIAGGNVVNPTVNNPAPSERYSGALVPKPGVVPKILFSNDQPQILEIGDSGVTMDPNSPQGGPGLAKFLGSSQLKVEILEGKVLVSCTIRDKTGNPVLILERNEWQTTRPPAIWDRNYTDDTLEVIDNTHNPILQLRVLGNRIQLQGRFYDSDGHVITIMKSKTRSGYAVIKVDDSKNATEDNMLPPENLEPLFKYPSDRHLGEYR